MAKKDVPFEVPEQMREFADQSLDGARKAFNEYLESSRSAVEKMSEQAETMQSSTREAHEKTMSYAEENVTAAMDYARELVNATTLTDIMAVQKRFLDKQMESLGSQSRQFADMAKDPLSGMAKK